MENMLPSLHNLPIEANKRGIPLKEFDFEQADKDLADIKYVENFDAYQEAMKDYETENSDDDSMEDSDDSDGDHTTVDDLLKKRGIRNMWWGKMSGFSEREDAEELEQQVEYARKLFRNFEADPSKDNFEEINSLHMKVGEMEMTGRSPKVYLWKVMKRHILLLIESAQVANFDVKYEWYDDYDGDTMGYIVEQEVKSKKPKKRKGWY